MSMHDGNTLLKNEVEKGEQPPVFLLHDADAGPADGLDGTAEMREKQVWERLQREALAAQRFRLEQELLLRKPHTPLHKARSSTHTDSTHPAAEPVGSADESPVPADDASSLLFWMVLGFVLTSIASLLVWLFYGLA
ncbi:MAG: hypothetical protein KDI15_00800 [Thiothrix sp.]|nr:hypothetical protein [Thiothrix sp.]